MTSQQERWVWGTEKRVAPGFRAAVKYVGCRAVGLGLREAPWEGPPGQPAAALQTCPRFALLASGLPQDPQRHPPGGHHALACPEPPLRAGPPGVQLYSFNDPPDPNSALR